MIIVNNVKRDVGDRVPLEGKDKELYDKHLAELQKDDPKVVLILDATEEDANWIGEVRKAREKKKAL